MADKITINKYAISDIHGCPKTFQRLVEEKLALKKTDHLYLLGDYINRGPDSKGVIDYILALKGLGYKVHTLRGNHEDLLLEAYDDPKRHNRFLKNGGKITLASFDAQHVRDIPEVYLQFIRETKFYFEVDNFLLVHAGFNFTAKDPFKDYHSMMWMRKIKVDKDILGDRIIVHGHTPAKKKKVRDQFKKGKIPQLINIDSSCVYYPKKGCRLCALELNSLKPTFSRNVEWKTNDDY